MQRAATTFAIFAFATVGIATSAFADPDNARQSAEGYWIGGTPVLEDVDWFVDNNIQLVIGATSVETVFREALDDEDIEWARASFNNARPSTDRLLELTEGMDPSTVFVHCEHGADRSGAMLAMLLNVRHGYSPDAAFMSVVNPGGNDQSRMIEHLGALGFEVTTEEEALAGIYSGASNGGHGGYKIRGDGYRELVASTIDAMVELGATRDFQPEIMWSRDDDDDDDDRSETSGDETSGDDTSTSDASQTDNPGSSDATDDSTESQDANDGDEVVQNDDGDSESNSPAIGDPEVPPAPVPVVDPDLPDPADAEPIEEADAGVIDSDSEPG